MATRLYGNEKQSRTMDELDALLEQLGKRGYVLHAFHMDMHGPDILAAVCKYSGLADVVLLHDETHACAWRMPTGPNVDVFNPLGVLWHYAHTPVWTLRALLTLASPGHPEAPIAIMDVPRGYGLPREGRTPVKIKVPRWHGSLNHRKQEREG